MKLLEKSLLAASALAAPLLSNAASFEAASKYLDTDGSFIAYVDFAGDGAAIGQQLNQILAEVRTGAPEATMIVPPINFEQLFGQLGFGSMQALGASSKALDNGLQANRSVMLTDGTLSGLFAMYGSAEAPMSGFDLAERAPADSNTVVSGPLYITPLRDLVKKLMTQYMGTMGTGLVDQQLAAPLLGTDITANELIEALSGHFEFCMYQGYKDELSPEYKIWASLENAGSLVDRLKAAEETLPIVFSESNGATIADLSALLGQEAMGLFLKHDPSGALHVYTHADWGPHTDGPKLADSEAFQKFSELLPEEAHWYSYAEGASQDIEAMFATFEAFPAAAPYLSAGRKAFDLLLGDFMKPAASATIITEDAVYSEVYASYSYKQLVTAVPAVFAGGLAASVAVPYYMFGQAMDDDFDMDMMLSDEEQIEFNLSTILTAAQIYMLDEGVNEITYKQLLEQEENYGVSDIEPVLGESYDDIVITAETEELSIELPDGRVITSSF